LRCIHQHPPAPWSYPRHTTSRSSPLILRGELLLGRGRHRAPTSHSAGHLLATAKIYGTRPSGSAAAILVAAVAFGVRASVDAGDQTGGPAAVPPTSGPSPTATVPGVSTGRLAEAADHPIALQLRNLQVLGEIAVEQNSTIVFPAQFLDSARAASLRDRRKGRPRGRTDGAGAGSRVAGRRPRRRGLLRAGSAPRLPCAWSRLPTPLVARAGLRVFCVVLRSVGLCRARGETRDAGHPRYEGRSR
jgi:hypothetical protein